MHFAPAPTRQAIIGDFELDTILRLKKLVYDMATVFAGDQGNLVSHHLEAAFEYVKSVFLDAGNEDDERTPVVVITLWNMLFGGE